MTINLNLRKDTRGRMHPDDLSTPKKSWFTPTEQSLKARFSLGFYSLTINNYQEVQLKRSDGKNTIRASDPQTDGQLNTTLLSLAMVVTLSLLILLEQSSSQTLAEQDNTCSPLHQHHDDLWDPTLDSHTVCHLSLNTTCIQNAILKQTLSWFGF